MLLRVEPEGKEDLAYRDVRRGGPPCLRWHLSLVGGKFAEDASVLCLGLGRLPRAEKDFATASARFTDSDAGLPGGMAAVGRRGATFGACHLQLLFNWNAELFCIPRSSALHHPTRMGTLNSRSALGFRQKRATGFEPATSRFG